MQSPAPMSTVTKKCRQDVNPAANFNLNDGVNIRCFASNRKSRAVAICNLRRFQDDRHARQSHTY
jgi:hypothetical protein